MHAPVFYRSQRVIDALYPIRQRLVALTTPDLYGYRTLYCPGGRVSVLFILLLLFFFYVFYARFENIINYYFVFQPYTVVVHNARRSDGLGPSWVQGEEYSRMIKVTLTFELAQLQQSLYCGCHGTFCVVFVGDMSGMPTSVKVLGILPLRPA